MEEELPIFNIPARVYVQLLSPNHPVAGSTSVQNGYGALSNFFGSLARTAKHIIFPNLVKMGRNVVSDIIGNKETLIDSARHRTMETLQNVGAQLQRGEGKRRRRKRKSRKTKMERKGRPRKKQRATKKVSKRKTVKRRTKKKFRLPLSVLLKKD